MKTKMPLSTISFNSDKFLLDRLNFLYKNDIVLFYTCVKHHAEESEKKDHWHIYIEPNGRIDTDALRREYFTEPVINDKPLVSLPFRTSKFADWEMYTEHWKPYIYKHGLTKKYEYTDADFYSSDEFMRQELLDSMDRNDYTSKIYDFIKDYIERGLDFADFVNDGYVPINQIKNYKEAFNLLKLKYKINDKK